MESLDQILRRISKPSQSKTDAVRRDGLNTEPVCPRCLGYGWVCTGSTLQLAVPPDFIGADPDKGIGPCPACRKPEDALKRRLIYADMPITKRTFENFEVRAGTEGCYTASREFASGDPGYAGLTITGPVGNGKSHLLQAIGWEMMPQGYAVKYVCVGDLLQKLRDTYDPASQVQFASLWDSYQRASVLLLDDLTENPRPTPWAQGQMERLVDSRYRDGSPWVITTNLTLEVMAEVWGWRVADRIFDEHSGIVRVVYNTAKSYRTAR